VRIVVPRETYSGERRVMVLPSSAKVLVEGGHDVFVQSGATAGLDIPDKRYVDVGAKIITDAADLYAQAKDGMVIKMKAPTPEEFSFMRKAVLFCMLHIEQNKDRLYYMGTQELIGVAMEEIRDEKGKRHIDQTDITGQMGVYYSIRHFLKIPSEMKAVILGYGNVAKGAIAACSRLGIDFKIMRRSELKNLPLWLREADLLINAISWPEKQREKKEYLVTRDAIKASSPNLIILDLSVDFPNPIETMHVTTYQNPFYLEEGRIHISIYGYPGLVPVTSSRVYSEQVLPIALAIANNGGLKAISKRSEWGASIHHAIVDPLRFGDYEQFRPSGPVAPRIE